jgi:uncharacterized OB-fold protein
MASDPTARPLPAVDFLKIPEQGDPYLEGSQCKACGSVFLGQRMACSKCGAVDQLETRKLGSEGELYVYSIVHRSFPGVQVPYVSAIVDLAGGGTVKGNLIGIDPSPEKIKMGMPVRVVFKDALGRKDRDGNSYLSYFFEPA